MNIDIEKLNQERNKLKAVAVKLFEVHKELLTVSIKTDSKNPHFGNKYPSLEAVTLPIKKVLLKHGLFVSQPVESNLVVTEIIDAETGQVLAESRFPIIAKDMNDPQKFGGGVTYARRYSLLSLFAIPVDDDDGNTAAEPNGKDHDWSETLTGASKSEFVNITANKFGELDKKIPGPLLKYHLDWVGKTWNEVAQLNGFKDWVEKLIKYESAKSKHAYKEKNLTLYRAALALCQ